MKRETRKLGKGLISVSEIGLIVKKVKLMQRSITTVVLLKRTEKEQRWKRYGTRNKH